MGFPARWRDWIAASFSTASSQVLLNGIPGQLVAHGRGLRQGDPLSPLLFILAIDPLQRLLSLATEAGILTRVARNRARLRVSLYADDAVIFLRPIKHEVRALSQLLNLFGQVTGLQTNIHKSSIAAIRCEGINLDDVLADFTAARASFPIKYLGLPLSVRRLRKVDFQPLIDKAASRLSGWRGRNISQAGRATLTKSVLSSQPVYLLTALNSTKEVLESIDKLRKKFLWAGDENLTGGKCKINWPTVARPTDLGGAGLLDLERFARALRLRWLWQEWTMPEKPWVGMGTPCSETDKLLFAASTEIRIGDGRKVCFWESARVAGRRPRDIAPDLYSVCKRKNSKLHEALTDNRWIRDLTVGPNCSLHHLQQLVELWFAVKDTSINPGAEDTIRWKWTANGEYTTASAYRAQFLGSIKTDLHLLIWKPWAPPKCKFFAWLIIENRVWTSDRLAIRGWPRSDVCPLCRTEPESAHHLLVKCRFTKRMWRLIADWLNCQQLHPSGWDSTYSVNEWWHFMGKLRNVPKRAIKSLLLLVNWEIWKERNSRTFDRREVSTLTLLGKIKEEAKMWGFAGARHLASFVGD